MCVLLIIIIQKICSAHISTLLGAQGRESRNTGASPFSFTISVLGSFTYITQHTGPTALRPIRRTKQLWLSVLLKDTSTATGQARIRTHIITTSELESNALDRSATTWWFMWYCHISPARLLLMTGNWIGCSEWIIMCFFKVYVFVVAILPQLKPLHTIGKVSVNASILYKNQEICRKLACEHFSSFRYLFYKKTVKMHSAFLYLF